MTVVVSFTLTGSKYDGTEYSHFFPQSNVEDHKRDYFSTVDRCLTATADGKEEWVGGEESGWHTALPNRDKIIFVRVGGTRRIRHGGRAHISSHMKKCYYPLGKRGVNNCSQRNSIGCRLVLRSHSVGRKPPTRILGRQRI